MSGFADISGSSRVHFAGRPAADTGFTGYDIDQGSLSSVDGADAPRGGADDSSIGLYDETMPLYQRLQELDQLTASFLQRR